MKRTDLEKLNGLKIRNRMKHDATPDRFRQGQGAAKAATNPLIEKLLKKGLAGEREG